MARAEGCVLVVEDDADVRTVLTAVLEEAGYDVQEAGDGEDALSLLRSGVRVALILLDLHMPRMDGRAFRALQLADPALAAIRIVVVSGDVDGATAALELGAVGHCQKPFDPETLLGVVAGVCAAAAVSRGAVVASSYV